MDVRKGIAQSCASRQKLQLIQIVKVWNGACPRRNGILPGSGLA